MSLTSEQQAAFDALNQRFPEDLVTGYQVPQLSKPDADSEWLQSMKQLSRDWLDRAASYYNVQARRDRLSTTTRQPRRILSDTGFPATVKITYAEAPALSYLIKTEPREIKHIVFHSFGHTWHANSLPGKKKWGGWFNRVKDGEGVVPYEYNGQTIYVAKGSDPTTLTHPDRYSRSIQAALGPSSRSTAHFYIDRAGNLLVVGDVNYVMFVADAVNETSISIGLEEAFYLLTDPNEEKAIWNEGGVPPGTEGNVQYFSFSPQQLLTLSIVCKKLETAFPNIASRNVDFTRRALTADSASGYTMHDFVSGAKHIDISPHFLTRAIWDEFFTLVDTHTQVNQTNVWKPRSPYKDSGLALASAPISEGPSNLITQRFLEGSRGLGLGLSRARLKATQSKSEVVQEAGDKTSLDSQKVAQTAANTYNLIQQTANLPATLVEDDLPEDEQGGWDDTW